MFCNTASERRGPALGGAGVFATDTEEELILRVHMNVTPTHGNASGSGARVDTPFAGFQLPIQVRRLPLEFVADLLKHTDLLLFVLELLPWIPLKHFVVDAEVFLVTLREPG